VQAKRAKNTVYLVLGGLVLLVAAALATALSAPPDLLYGLVRGCALLGYALVFCAILSNAYITSLVRFFGRSFIQVHHIISISGLVIITLHPLALAIYSGALSVFLPVYSSVIELLQYAGRPAWYLLLIAALAAVLRQSLKKSWRTIHWLNYLAFALASIHAMLIGGNFQAWPARIIAIILMAVIIYVFVTKRLKKAKRAAAR